MATWLHNEPEEEWEHDYFMSLPYTVEIFANDVCENIYRTDSLSNAQAKFDSWEQDLQDNTDVKVLMFKYNPNEYAHEQISYDGKVLDEV